MDQLNQDYSRGFQQRGADLKQSHGLRDRDDIRGNMEDEDHPENMIMDRSYGNTHVYHDHVHNHTNEHDHEHKVILKWGSLSKLISLTLLSCQSLEKHEQESDHEELFLHKHNHKVILMIMNLVIKVMITMITNSNGGRNWAPMW